MTDRPIIECTCGHRYEAQFVTAADGDRVELRGVCLVCDREHVEYAHSPNPITPTMLALAMLGDGEEFDPDGFEVPEQWEGKA